VDIALSESLNAIWKHVLIHKDLGIEDSKSAIQDLTKIHDKLKVITTREACEEALDIAFAHHITIYDALYISATEKTRGILYTADQKLHNKVKKITSSKLLEPQEKNTATHA